MKPSLERGEGARALGGIGGALREFIDAVVGDEFALDAAGQNDRADIFVGLCRTD